MNRRNPLIGTCLIALAGFATPAHAGWKLFKKAPAAETQQNVAPVALTKVDAVFLHGLGGDPSHFPLHELQRNLRKAGIDLKLDSPWLRPVRIDADGEPHATGPHTMTDQLARARAAIQQHDGPVILFGHSFGGKAAIALAKEMPDKVKAIVAFAPSVKMLYAYWKNVTGERGLPPNKAVVLAKLEEHGKKLQARLNDADPESDEADYLRSELGYHKTMVDLVQHDETAMESDVKVPMLMLHGEEDSAVSIHYARRFAEANPMVKLVEYPGVHHGMSSKDRKLGMAAQLDMTSRINQFLNELQAKK